MKPEETIALMAIHGLAQFGANTEELDKYKWIGGSRIPSRSKNPNNVWENNNSNDEPTSNPVKNVKAARTSDNSFNNIYYKLLNGAVYQ